MSEKKIDVRAAVEWAWLQADNCIIRNGQGIPISVNLQKATAREPQGGRQFLDMAFSNKVAFQTLVLKTLGSDIDEDDEVAVKEKKSITALRVLLKRFKESGKKVA